MKESLYAARLAFSSAQGVQQIRTRAPEGRIFSMQTPVPTTRRTHLELLGVLLARLRKLLLVLLCHG